MANVDDWFWGFITLHMDRCPRSDWPGEDSGFWEGFLATLARHGVTEALADEASLAMMDAPAPYLGDLVSAFITQVKLIRARSTRPAASASDPTAESFAAFNASAAAAWESLDEADRAEWRAFVLSRLPMLESTPNTLELIAMGWNHDPSFIVAPLDPAPHDEPRPERPVETKASRKERRAASALKARQLASLKTKYVAVPDTEPDNPQPPR